MKQVINQKIDTKHYALDPINPTVCNFCLIKISIKIKKKKIDLVFVQFMTSCL